jgi:hypothetical protein
MRGLIFTDDIMRLPENKVKFQSGLNSSKIKNSLLYWDKISYVTMPHLTVNPKKDFLNEISTLQQESILDEFLLLTKDEIDNFKQNGISVPNHINRNNIKIMQYEPYFIKGDIEGVGLLKSEDYLVAGEGLKVGDFMRVKELYINTLRSQSILTEHLNNEMNGFWSMARASQNFVMPSLSGLTKESNILELSLSNLIPLPLDSTPVDKILEFKLKYKAELLAFQVAMSNLNQKIEISNGDFRVIQDCKDEIRLSLNNLHRVLDETRIQKIAGHLKTFLDIRQLGSIPVISSAIAHFVEIPLLYGTLAGFAVSSGIELASKKENKIQGLSSPMRDYAYLYYAQNELK